MPSVKAASMWSKTYGGNDWKRPCSMIATSDGGYAILSAIGQFDLNPNVWLAKTDALGSTQWNKTYEGTEYYFASSLIATSDGGYAMAGSIPQYGTGKYDLRLIKTDTTGNIQWNKTYEVAEIADLHTVYSLIATPDGGYAVAGGQWLVKTDASGNMQWNKTYEGNARALVAASDGGYALAGHTGGYTQHDGWFMKTDASGNMQWNKTYGGAEWDEAYALAAASDGGYAIAGYTGVTSGDPFKFQGNFWLVKTDAAGNIQWNRTYGPCYMSVMSDGSLVATSDGGYAMACTWDNTDTGGDSHAWLVKTDASGNMLWNQTYGETGSDLVYALAAISDGGYAIAGASNCTNFSVDLENGETFYQGELLLIKTDENGIVPEYSSWLIPAMTLTATAFILVSKKRLLHKRTQA